MSELIPGAEQTPEEYQPKHSRNIHLDTYRGVACDLMELNDPVADRFMQVSDMRGDVIIIQKPQDRVRDYEDVGFVRVAKLLKLPRLDFWNGNDLVQTKKEDNTWFVAVNDQDLADKVARAEDDDRRFEDRYVDAFRSVVKTGLATCLKREKLLNGGEYDPAFLLGYNYFIGWDLLLTPTILAAGLLTGENPLEALGKAGLVFGVGNAVHNAFLLFCVGMNYVRQRLISENERIARASMFNSKFFNPVNLDLMNFNEPFIKHSVPELLMPTVPVDRLIRGMWYLEQHGDDLINVIKKSN